MISALGNCAKVKLTETDLGTSHDTWEIVVCLEWRFVRFPNDREWRVQSSESANGQFRRSSDATNVRRIQGQSTRDLQLQEAPSFIFIIGRHDVDQILDCSTLEVVSVVCLKDLLES